MIKTIPKEGDIIGGYELKHKREVRHMWVICPICEKGHWVRLDKGKPRNVRCQRCASIENIKKVWKQGKEHPNWKGERRKTTQGYILIYVGRNNAIVPEYKTPYIYEHRLVMAKYMGRPLKKWEMVHHINGKKDDNRIENLELVNGSEHLTITNLTKNIEKLEKENKILKNKIKILGGL